MTGTIETLFLATALFVGMHFAMAGRTLRAMAVEALGENGYLGLYSAVSGVAFVWMLLAYADAPYVEYWADQAWTHWVPNIVVPISSILIVCGFTVANPTAVGGERAFEDPKGPRGILTVTRHPFLWGVGLWALAHLVANGDGASVILFGGITILSFAGMHAIDTKRRERLGAEWGPFELTTSIMPFRAIFDGRAKLDWSGIGIMRIGAGLLLWAGLLISHLLIIGASPLPT